MERTRGSRGAARALSIFLLLSLVPATAGAQSLDGQTAEAPRDAAREVEAGGRAATPPGAEEEDRPRSRSRRRVETEGDRHHAAGEAHRRRTKAAAPHRRARGDHAPRRRARGDHAAPEHGAEAGEPAARRGRRRDAARDRDGAEAPPDPGRVFHLGLEAVNDFPLDVGGQLTFEMPYGLRLSTSFGVLPRAFVDAISSVAVDAGLYDDNAATLVSNALENAFVWRLHAGWRPFPSAGFYLEVGYGMVSVGSRASSADVVAALTGQTLPAGVPSDLGVDLESTIHMVDIEIGWELVVASHLVLRLALGAALTVGASTQITPDSSVSGYLPVQQYAGEAEATIDDALTSYAFLPTLSIALGYRLF